MAILKTRKGKILAVCTSEKKHIKKTPVELCFLKKDYGLEGDSHAGPGNKQVSLLARESVLKMETEKLKLPAGVFGENILTEGIDYEKVHIGQRIKLGGNVILEVTEKGKICTSPCSIYRAVGFCVMPKEGIFAKVIEEGSVKPGDSVEVC